MADGCSICQPAERKKNANALVAESEGELAQKSAVEWEEILQSAGVPCARLRSLPEALASPQVEARGSVQETQDGVHVPTLPFRLGHAAGYPPSRPAPRKGQQNDEILTWLEDDNVG